MNRSKPMVSLGYNVFKTFWRIFLLVFVLVPIVWGFRTSVLENPYEISVIPSAITFSNYQEFLAPDSSFWFAMRNSLFAALGTICLMLPIVVPGSYALGRMSFRGKRLGKIFIYLPLIPAIALLVQLGRIVNSLHLMNNLFAVILLNSIFLTPFTMWILRNFMRSISPSMEEAATIDGCGQIRTLLFIILPNALPGIISIIVYIFISSWLNFLYAYTVINNENMMLVPQLVQSFIGLYSTNYTVLCTFSMIALVPPLIFFIFFQKWFIAGLFGNTMK